jgi:hypothetical protein
VRLPVETEQLPVQKQPVMERFRSGYPAAHLSLSSSLRSTHSVFVQTLDLMIAQTYHVRRDVPLWEFPASQARLDEANS